MCSGEDRKAHILRRQIWDTGRLAIPGEVTVSEKSNASCVSRLWLTLLAPIIVEAIVDGRQPPELGVHVLREGFPVEWGEQRAVLGHCQLQGGNICYL
jgi:hypothetical protein